jgi:hypothetical protein
MAIRHKTAGGIQRKLQDKCGIPLPPFQHDGRVDDGEYEKTGHTASIPACREKHDRKRKHKHRDDDNPRPGAIAHPLFQSKAQKEIRQYRSDEVEGDVEKLHPHKERNDSDDKPRRHACETEQIERLYAQIKRRVEISARNPGHKGILPQACPPFPSAAPTRVFALRSDTIGLHYTALRCCTDDQSRIAYKFIAPFVWQTSFFDGRDRHPTGLMDKKGAG